MEIGAGPVIKAEMGSWLNAQVGTNVGTGIRSGIETGVGQVSTAVGDKVQTALDASIYRWLASHPILEWLVHHPLVAIGIFMVLLLVLQGLLGAIAHFARQLWISIFQIPIRGGRWILGVGVRPFRRENRQERLEQILNRLEEIRQEQDLLLQELRLILPQTNPAADLPPLAKSSKETPVP